MRSKKFFDASVYLPFTKSAIQEVLIYKFSFVTWLFSNFLQIAIIYYLWKSIFDSSEHGLISGFTFLDMQVYIVMSFITKMLVSGNVEWKVAQEIVEGSIATVLIKPINYFFRLIFESLAQVIVNFIAIMLPVWSFLLISHKVIYDIPFPNPLFVLLFFLSILLSYIISFLINFLIGLCAFVVTYMWGFLICKDAIFMLLSGVVVPLTMFPDTVQRIITYLPFASLNYIPVMIYMQEFDSSEILFYLAIQLFWVVALMILTIFFWKRAIKRLSVAGG